MSKSQLRLLVSIEFENPKESKEIMLATTGSSTVSNVLTRLNGSIDSEYRCSNLYMKKDDQKFQVSHSNKVKDYFEDNDRVYVQAKKDQA